MNVFAIFKSDVVTNTTCVKGRWEIYFYNHIKSIADTDSIRWIFRKVSQLVLAVNLKLNTQNLGINFELLDVIFRVTKLLAKLAFPQSQISNSAIGTLKQKHHHSDKTIVTSCTENCQFDNFWYSQWWLFHQNDNIPISVNNDWDLWCISVQLNFKNVSFYAMQKSSCSILN